LRRQRLSILMPVYNERPFVRRCIERVLSAPLPDGLERELIVVDDHSTDGTTEVLQEIAARHSEVMRLFRQDRNRGKGAAIRRAVQEMQGDLAVIQDADLEYDPNEYGRLLAPILGGQADVVYGSRFTASLQRRVLNYHHALGNIFLTHVSNLTTGLNLTDMETGYKVFRADILRTIPIRSNRFGFEPEITAKVAKRNCTVYEVPVSYYGRSYSEGKKIKWTDGLLAIYTILKYWFIDDCYSDRFGHAILASLAGAHRFTKWVVASIEPYLGQRLLEVGSGIGNISRQLPKRERLTVSDCDEVYLELLDQAFRQYEAVDVARVNLDSDEDFAGLKGSYDTVICLNVLEHIKNDDDALRRMASALSPGGRLILQLPQYPWLMAEMDRKLGHHRRYSKRGLLEKLESAGLSMERRFNMNAAGVLGWLFSAKLLKRQELGKFQLKIFNTLVPVFRAMEALLPLPGLSLMVIAKAPEVRPPQDSR
jgi:glycosyltransferase involved in cell wall biosynthesis